MATGKHVEAMGDTWRPQPTQGPWGHGTVTMGMCAGRKGTYKAMRGTRDGHSETPVAAHHPMPFGFQCILTSKIASTPAN